MEDDHIIAYHSERARRELDLGLTASGMRASRAHMELASLHMQRMRELAGSDRKEDPILRM